YEAVMAVINGKASASEKSDEELAREVLAGKHGAGEDRKRSLGPRYEPVQAKVNELLKAKEKPSEVVKNEPQTVQFKEDGDLSFNGAILKKSV
ncbi:holin, partial [Streptococcus suis]|nr:holin [Streptococcus suis]